MSSPLDAPLTIRRTSLHHLHPIREAHRGPNLSHCLIWRGAGERLALVDDPGRQCRSALVAGHGRETMDYPARNEEGLFDLEHQGALEHVAAFISRVGMKANGCAGRQLSSA